MGRAPDQIAVLACIRYRDQLQNNFFRSSSLNFTKNTVGSTVKPLDFDIILFLWNVCV